MRRQRRAAALSNLARAGGGGGAAGGPGERGRGDEPDWVSVRPSADGLWSLEPAGPNLYDGAAGIALFLAYLSSLTGSQRHAALARAALGGFAERSAAAQTIGAFDGQGGLIYVLGHL